MMTEEATRAVDNEEAVPLLLRTGLAHHRAGELAEAAGCYRRLLALRPKHADAMNLLGVLARQSGDLDGSERLIRAAIAQDPAQATFHHHLGKTCAARGRAGEAAESFRCALALQPGDVDSMQLLAALLGESGSWAEATGLYERLVELQPQTADWLYKLGQSLRGQGRASDAVRCYRRAVQMFPESVDALFNLAQALFEAGEREESLEGFRRVAALKPGDAEAHHRCGVILHGLGEPVLARRAYVESIRCNPDGVEALCNLGALLLDASELAPAEALLRRALEHAPEFLCALSNLGSVLAKQGRYLEAFETFRRILLREPTHAMALCSMGFSLDALGDLDGARECFELALRSEPDSALTHFNLSAHLLLEGRFEEGWRGYERRWELRQFAGVARALRQPRWQGEELAGGSIFLFSEQGLGDTLQFFRYALLLAGMGARVVLEVQELLAPLLEGAHPDVEIVTREREELPATDWYCPLLSLPKMLGTELGNIPAAVPYLWADGAKARRWAVRLRSSPGCRVGVVWSGNPEHTRDRLRSIPFAQFRQVLRRPEVSFYSLQKGPGAMQASDLEQSATWCALGPSLVDLTETAAVIANLDLVITVDTAVAHLAGAMGKPVWILLAHAPDWRWLKGRSDSPWYPTARLFRQSRPGEWRDVLERVEEALGAFAGGLRRGRWEETAELSRHTRAGDCLAGAAKGIPRRW